MVVGGANGIDFYPRPPHGGRLDKERSSQHDTDYFYPRPPHGGRQIQPGRHLGCEAFLSTPSAWRATSPRRHFVIDRIFLSTPSAWRATLSVRLPFYNWSGNFYPRPPHGGRQVRLEGDRQVTNFYPRPPHGGRRVKLTKKQKDFCISIHALRMEGDLLL